MSTDTLHIIQTQSSLRRRQLQKSFNDEWILLESTGMHPLGTISREPAFLTGRFSDGFRYGFGAEVGVSTGKLHARGPVGLEGLTSYKYLISGNGQGAGMYSESSGKKFLHNRRI